jgi:dienelactone hydrolase
MSSNPPSKCCTIGVRHSGESTGELKFIGESKQSQLLQSISIPSTHKRIAEAYFAYPPDKSTTNAILLITDVIGHKYINVQLIADQYAANGYFVVMPDLFHGDPVKLNPPEGFQVMEWLKGHPTGVVAPIVDACIKEMRGNLGVKNLGAVGYCFGAKYVARFLNKGQIDAGFVAHPSFVDDEEIKGMEGPFSIAAAGMFYPYRSVCEAAANFVDFTETDHIFPTEKRRHTEELLLKMDIPWQINLYSDTEHGFAVRADLSKPAVKFAKEQAFLQAVHWFDTYVKKA